jgi:hypothetical protein
MQFGILPLHYSDCSMQHIVAAAACTDMVTGSEFWIPQVLFRPQKLVIFCTSMQYIDAAATCTDMVTGSEIWIPHVLFWPQKLVFSVLVCSIDLDAAAACIDMVTVSPDLYRWVTADI